MLADTMAFVARPPLLSPLPSQPLLSRSDSTTARQPPTFSRVMTPKCDARAENNGGSEKKTVSRRRVLQGLGAMGLSATLPAGAADAVGARIGGNKSENVEGVDYVFDAHSGSFVPSSNIDDILRHNAGSLFDRCIIAAEVHNNARTHRTQLAIIDSARRLNDGREVMVGFEQFYFTHNSALEAYSVHGALSLEQLLGYTDWENTWGYDMRLYLPIFEYCRRHRIRMIGLNIPSEIPSFVAQNGFSALPQNVMDNLPKDMDFDNSMHRKHFMQLMGQDIDESSTADTSKSQLSFHQLAAIENYYEAQVLWDEWMSYVSAHFLTLYPSHRLVTLIGNGHVEQRVGYPDRLEKRVNERPYTIVQRPVSWRNDGGYSMPDIESPETNTADLVWYSREA